MATHSLCFCRLLNETAYNNIWSVARETLKKSHYNFRKAGTLKGSEEGAYGWTALNYLNGGFMNNVSFVDRYFLYNAIDSKNNVWQ